MSKTKGFHLGALKGMVVFINVIGITFATFTLSFIVKWFNQPIDPGYLFIGLAIITFMADQADYE